MYLKKIKMTKREKQILEELTDNIISDFQNEIEFLLKGLESDNRFRTHIKNRMFLNFQKLNEFKERCV